MSVSNGESSNTKNLIGSTDIDIIVSGDDLSLKLNDDMKDDLKEDIIDSIPFSPFILSEDIEVGSSGGFSNIQINYPSNTNKDNLHLISIKFKDKLNDNVPYQTKYITSYISSGTSTISYEASVKISYQSNGMYLSGRSPIVDTTITLELIFMKIS